MSLRDVHIKDEYRSLSDKVARDFFIPLLQEACTYKRAVGFFSSSSLIEISKGVCSLAKRNGKIQMVASPYLSKEDISAIKNGYLERNEVIKKALLSSLKEESDFVACDRLNLLANLIANGVMDIKIAITKKSDGIGMYHEKMGIIEDTEGNVVAFSGSMNESATAMHVNYEAIDVFCSWNSDGESKRVINKQEAFKSIWENSEENIEVLDFPEIKDEILSKYKMNNSPNYYLDTDLVSLDNNSQIDSLHEDTHEYTAYPNPPYIPDSISLREYQKTAISNWEKNGFQGIFNMATGTGKTLTGLGAVVRLAQKCRYNLAVIILCPYQHLVEQWVEDIVRFNINPIIGYSSSSQSDWKKILKSAINEQWIRPEDRGFFCFITTNDTFKSQDVQTQISSINSKILLLVDEAHNVGACQIRNFLDDKFDYRLALSATLDRHNDEEGTSFLHSYFGEECIHYDLERAIKEGMLTPYRYYPVVVIFQEEELSEYDRLSSEIAKCITRRENKHVLTKRGEMLLLQRARLVAGAKNKIEKLEEVIRPYKDKGNLLIYCGATSINADFDFLKDAKDADIKQIEAILRLLGTKLGMDVSKFTSEENIQERKTIIHNFMNESLQAIVAIKCLDEGVNIPCIKTAFILASTTNPKEYIQRRGRVLRKYKGKSYAEIYDFITLPRALKDVAVLSDERTKKDLSLVKNELSRMVEFNRLASNPMESYELIWEIKKVYQISDEDKGENE